MRKITQTATHHDSSARQKRDATHDLPAVVAEVADAVGQVRHADGNLGAGTEQSA
jgi:hypothetical protein